MIICAEYFLPSRTTLPVQTFLYDYQANTKRYTGTLIYTHTHSLNYIYCDHLLSLDNLAYFCHIINVTGAMEMVEGKSELNYKKK